jgi:chitinase
MQVLLFVFVLLLASLVSSQTCSSNQPCQGNPAPCCSIYGYCGTTSDYCAQGNCVANCWSTPSSSNIFVAYIPSWATDLSAPCGLNINTLDVTKFTHLFVPFATFDTTNFVLNANGDDTSGWYSKVMALKSKNSKLKVVISVGGGSFGGAPWAVMVNTANNRAAFISNAIKFARKYNFDGIDIDWEAPDSTGQTPQILSLFSAFRTAINNDAAQSGKAALLLIVTSPNYAYAINLFGFPNIIQYLDWVNVMNYDYYGTWSPTIGAQTAFAGPSSIQASFAAFSGIPRNKLTLGFANYARTFKLSNPSQNTPGSPFVGAGAAGPCTTSPGTYNYYEVGQYISTHPTGQYVYDTASQTPYFYYGTQWITYDNQQSLQVKMNYLLAQGFKGAMIWALDGNTTITNFISAGLGI